LGSFGRRLGQKFGIALQPPAPNWRDKIRIKVGDIERGLGLKGGYVPKGHWPVLLKHATGIEEGRSLLIWALGSDRETIRRVCDGFARLLGYPATFNPILLTDVADFAFYARLGWLVEYLPNWEGDNGAYRNQKLRYLAWRYRDAVVMPLSVGLVRPPEWQELLGLDVQ
jgi:hypothetical protein